MGRLGIGAFAAGVRKSGGLGCPGRRSRGGRREEGGKEAEVGSGGRREAEYMYIWIGSLQNNVKERSIKK